MTRMLLQLVGVFGFWIARMPLAARLGASPSGMARIACAGAGLTLLGYGLLPGRRGSVATAGTNEPSTPDTAERTTV